MRIRFLWVRKNCPYRATFTRPRNPAEWSRNLEMVLLPFLTSVDFRVLRVCGAPVYEGMPMDKGCSWAEFEACL